MHPSESAIDPARAGAQIDAVEDDLAVMLAVAGPLEAAPAVAREHDLAAAPPQDQLCLNDRVELVRAALRNGAS